MEGEGEREGRERDGDKNTHTDSRQGRTKVSHKREVRKRTGI